MNPLSTRVRKRRVPQRQQPDPHQTPQRCSTTENGGIAIVVAVICESGTHDPNTVRKKVMGWVRVGRRNRGLMQALCSGCIILFLEKPSDLVWEQYVPIKGDMVAKVIQFLQDLGIVGKCEEEGWNDLSDKILQTLRVHFRSLIPFRFQPDQQSQIGWAANSSLAPVTSDTDIHRPERSMLSHERVEERRDMDIDNTPSSRTINSKALPRLAANGLIKTKWPDAVPVRYFGDRIQDMLLTFYEEERDS
ncbi:uncharacterized protein PAC_15778 [Phialocephala subalpina]|uniref:Uncharacterized protein n=1 Tax=Phialocephala subalpina TaxID=576137 RepID=A0A1L7XLI1_9HELO|nr:uncharacterized protein PAC_15778 [Phialocephala subalpina]